MATLVCFHAHPDDEAIATGGTIARASDEGHRVVLVVATNGDHGELPEDLLPAETLVERRRAETAQAAEVLGIHRVVWLGYEDSGMTGWEQNIAPGSFHQAPLDEAAGRLATVLREEAADVLTTYDWHGVYGHPDHIKVHQVGRRAAELAGTRRVLETSINRDHIVRMLANAPQAEREEFDPEAPADDGNPLGSPEAELTHAIDVTAWIERKRTALACHGSQVPESSSFLQMSPEMFVAAFGTEWFIEAGIAPGIAHQWVFE
jgi:LmbE family N-acetylglucosaminyl deacetylase